MKPNSFLAMARGIAIATAAMCAHSALGATPERPAARPTVSIWVGRDVAPGPKIRLVVNTRNVPTVHMAAYRLDSVQWLLRRDVNRDRPPTPGEPSRKWDVSVRAANERANPYQRDFYRSRQVNLPPLPPGVYLLSAGGAENEAWAVVNITNLCLVVKRSPHRLLTWVAAVHTGAPVQNAAVRLYKRGGGIVAQGTTGRDGVAEFSAQPADDQVLIASSGRDLAAVPTGAQNPDGRLVSHFQTDRPIYQPGQTVLYKAILRLTSGRVYTPLAGADCHVEARDPKDNVISTEKAKTSAMGTLSGEISIPREGAVGPYSIVITSGERSAYATFSVAEYRKPEYKVAVVPRKTRYLAGERAAFDVSANYYFGAPVPQTTVRYLVTRAGLAFWRTDESDQWYSGGDGNLYPRDTYEGNPVVAEGTVYTDDTGHATIEFDTDKSAPDGTYTVSLTVQDASRRQVEASGSVPVYAALLRLDLRTDVLLTPLGGIVPFTVRVTNLDGKPAAASVKVTVGHSVWNEKAKEYVFVELSRTTVTVPASGTAVARIPAMATGDLEVTAAAQDPTGRIARVQSSILVTDPSGKTERQRSGPWINVRLDRKTYGIGNAVKAWVTTNVSNRPELVVLEGADIFQYKVVPAGTRGFLWTFRTSLKMSPDAFVSACTRSTSGLISASALVPCPDPSRRINVALTSEQANYKPGETARYTVKATGPNGAPVRADVAFSVVDESIFAVHPDTTPDLFTTFWGLRSNAVSTQSSAAEEYSGGAYQRVNTMAPVREKFLDTAFWQANVQTDATGTAIVDVPLPGNLTTWRATARAITSDTKAGSATATLKTARPVMLRLATPRQMVQGDRLTLKAVINNETDAPHAFETAISTDGLTVEGGTTRTVTVPANGEGSVEWSVVAATLPESGEASVTARTLAQDAPPDQGEEFSDALKMAIPVVPNGIPDHIVLGGVVEKECNANLDLPTDRIQPSGTVIIGFRAGMRAAAKEAAARAVAEGRWSTSGAADQLTASAAVPASADPDSTREALALISRCQHPDGAWGSWDGSPSDASITTRVLRALLDAKAAGIPVPDPEIQRAANGANGLFTQTNLWEHKALLASVAARANRAQFANLVNDVVRRGNHISPFARLSLAETLAGMGDKPAATAMVDEVVGNAVRGPEVTYVPASEHAGWSATTVETTAQALIDLLEFGTPGDIETQLATYLARPEYGEWRTQDEQALVSRALALYSERHPDAVTLGDVAVAVNGIPLQPAKPRPGSVLEFRVPLSALKDGANAISMTRQGSGDACYTVEATVFRPAPAESGHGLRVLRRFDVLNADGLWVEASGAVPPSTPIRATVIVWPDDKPDAIRITEPLPAGIEFSDSDVSQWGRQEVRNGAVIQDFTGPQGGPGWFRYYLRAESEGSVEALPATAEVVRRPFSRANSAPARIEVKQ